MSAEAQEKSATLRTALAGVAAELTALQAAATAAREADAAQLARAARQARHRSICEAGSIEELACLLLIVQSKLRHVVSRPERRLANPILLDTALVRRAKDSRVTPGVAGASSHLCAPCRPRACVWVRTPHLRL